MTEKSKSQKNNYLIYFDTSKEEAEIAVFCNEKKIAEEKWLAPRELSKTLSEKYSNILKNVGVSQDEITQLAVFAGPGSFTGLRIGISFVNGLAYALKIPVYEVRIAGDIKSGESKEIAVPFYGAPPKITKPRK